MPLFDASRVRAPPPEDVPSPKTVPSPQDAPSPEDANGSAEHPLSVGDLARGINDVLDTCFAKVWVMGELSGRGPAASGHWYFELKDDDAVVSCVMWRSAVARIRGQVDQGTEVLVRGHVGFYKNGRCQLYVQRMEPRGLGALEIKFRELKEKLQTEGLFDEARKQPLPEYPRTIGVVTSPTGAAVRDIIHVLTRRWPSVTIQIYPVRVQGEGAATEIAQAITHLDRHRRGAMDVLIVGRGGGSVEDLWAFNEEVVARAIAASGIPIISAVGHETDFSISDFVADVRAPTPSAAAEIVVPDRRELLRQLADIAQRLGRGVAHRLTEAASRLRLIGEHRFFKYPEEIAGLRAARVDEASGRIASAVSAQLDGARRHVHDLERRLAGVRPAARVAAQRGRLAVLATRFAAAGRRRCERSNTHLDGLARRLDALSPLAVLDRGYSITLKVGDGKAVRSPSAVADGDLLETVLAKDKRIRSRVEKK